MKQAKYIGLFVFLLFVSSCTRTPQDDQSIHYQIAKTRREKAEKAYQERAKHLIIVDAGHGAVDLGAHNSKCIEKNVCLATALLLKKHLTEIGYRVEMTRDTDKFIPLKDRVRFANGNHADLFISIHFNAAKNHSAQGIEVFYYHKKDQFRSSLSKRLGQYVITKMIAKTGAESRGVKHGNFCVIRDTQMPAILVEGGFITNAKEVKLLNDKRYLDKLAFAISEGVDRFMIERSNNRNT